MKKGKTVPALDREGNYIYIGRFDFGNDVVGLLGEVKSASGSVNMSFADTIEFPARHSKVEGVTYIIVGLQHGSWRQCLAVLMHEAFELAFMSIQCRFQPSESWNCSHANYLFVMTHEQFTEATCRAAAWLSKAMLPLRRLYDQMKKQKPKA